LWYEAVILASLAATVYFIVIFPVLTIFHCLSSKILQGPAKVVWFFIILFSWPLGATVYGIFGSGRTLYKWSFLPGVIAMGTLWWIFRRGGLYPG
jgi:hypothetical protein